jgi:hypothetical protein
MFNKELFTNECTVGDMSQFKIDLLFPNKNIFEEFSVLSISL